MDTPIPLLRSIALFLTAGLLEIGGGYMVWLWLREGRSGWLALAGGICLFVYGIVPVFQPAHFGRVYAPTGGCSSGCPFSGAGGWKGAGRTRGTWPEPGSACWG